VTRVAFVFPGQGSQHPGMGRELYESEPAAKAAFDEIDEALDAPLSRTCFSGSAEELAMTETTQPAILATSVAAWRSLEARGVKATHVAGHSLGEWSALVAAGVLRATDAASTVRRRGRYMQEAVPAGEGAMAAILGLDAAPLEEACVEAATASEIVSPANFNAPGQIVIAGHRAAVERAIAAAQARGAKRAMMLPVSAPFHCQLMGPAATRLREDLARLDFGAFRMPLVANVTADVVTDPGVERELLARQVTAPVRWQQCVERLMAEGVNVLVEVGPGKVLTGLARRIAKDLLTFSVGGPAEADEAAKALA